MKSKIFLFITIFLVAIVSVLLVTVYFMQKSTLNTFVADQIDAKQIERIEFFNDFVKQETRVLESLAKNRSVINFVKNGKNRDVVEAIFETFAYMHKESFQFRYIDKDGNEIIRLDNKKYPILVQKSKLQNKKGRYYFEDTMLKNKDEVYYSNFIERPIVPTLRIATPMVIESQKAGIIIINIDISKFLEKMQKTSIYEVSLIYEDGNIIINPDGAYNWTKDFKMNKNIFDIYPFLPKNFSTKDFIKTDDFYISKLSINMQNKIYMLLVPKKFKQYIQLEENTRFTIYILILITLFGLPIGYVVSSYIEKIILESVHIKEQVYVDELTKTFNRRAYNEKIKERLELFRRYNAKFSVLMYDIDDFKKVNDNYGHDIGDKVLVDMSELTKSIIRKTDTLYRLGGEEFIIIFPEMGLNEASFVAEKIRFAISTAKILEDEVITISLGLTQIKENDAADSIYKRVDTLLYEAKQNGKNQVVKN